MKILLIAVLLLMTGCTTNGVYDSGKTWTLVGAVVVGSIAASSGGGGGGEPDQLRCHWIVGPNGSTQYCR